MPFLIKNVNYRISNITAVQNCQKYGINVKIKDIININIYTLKQIAPMNKTIKLKCQCDNCKKEFNIEPRSYSLNEAKNNYIFCYRCKGKNTMINRYGAAYSGQVSEFMQKSVNTKIKRRLIDSNYQKNINIKTLKTVQKKYGKQYTSTNQVPKIKAKVRKTMFKNGTVPTSKQQEYFYKILGGELNYPFSHLSLDIALINEKIDIEYNGSGHDLKIKLKKCTREEFDKKEIKRNNFIRLQGWKQIFIISPKDKINLYTDEEYLKLIQLSKDYLLNTSHHWVNIYIEEDKFETSVYTKSIKNLIS